MGHPPFKKMRLIRLDARDFGYLVFAVDDRGNNEKCRCVSSDGKAIEKRKSMYELQKCDGAKPICGPCRRNPKDDECEYNDGPGRSRTKVLEDTVSRLEARLHELEHPEESTPAVTLHDPYGSYHESQRISRSPPALLIPENRSTTTLTSSFSPASTTSSLPSGRQWKNFNVLDTMTESTGSSGSSSSPIRQYSTQGSPYSGTKEPPFVIVQSLIDKFLPHAIEFGFFLNISRFRESALLHHSFGDHLRPSPALLSTAYLWGVHLSHSGPLMAQEYTFMMRALQYTATDLLGTHPNNVLHTLQSEVLLAYYFFRIGRFLEAKAHTATAISIALGCGLHRIRSTNTYPPSTIGLSSETAISLHPPNDGIEEGERINGFWAVFVLHKFISVALEIPSSICGTLEAPGMQLDTPWPLDSASYSEDLLHPNIQGSSTVRNFLSGTVVTTQDGRSMVAMNVKASILFHRAAHLTGQWQPNLQPREYQAFSATFQSINHLIETFRVNLPPLNQLEPKDPLTRTILLTHALTDAATIKLHNIFSYGDSGSKQQCLTAARNMVSFGGLNLHDIGFINPIMGTLWVTACHVFIDEISRVRSINRAWPTGMSGQGEEELMEKLRDGITALSLFSEESALMKYQLTKIQEAFSAI